jgi:hypothetical protein
MTPNGVDDPNRLETGGTGAPPPSPRWVEFKNGRHGEGQFLMSPGGQFRMSLDRLVTPGAAA